MKVQNAEPLHLALSHFHFINSPHVDRMGLFSWKGEPMNNETSKTSTPATASPLTAKPDLVKNIGGTTFDIHIHFSETSRETFTDKVVRLIKNDSGDETA